MVISDNLWFYWSTIQQLFTTMVFRKLNLATLTTAHLLYLLDHWTQRIPFHPAAGDADSSSFQHNGKRDVKYLFAKFTAPRCSLLSHLRTLQCLYSSHLTSISPHGELTGRTRQEFEQNRNVETKVTTTQSISGFRELFCKPEVFSLFYIIIPRSCVILIIPTISSSKTRQLIWILNADPSRCSWKFQTS